MKFGSVPVAEARGAVLAHAVRRYGLVLKKGQLSDKFALAPGIVFESRSGGMRESPPVFPDGSDIVSLEGL